MNRERSPGVKLALVGLVALVLIVPLLMVYALVYDREIQSQTAQQSITEGWGGRQLVTGPVLVIPWMQEVTSTETVNGTQTSRTTQVRRELLVSPVLQSVETKIDPDRKSYAIYDSVVYESTLSGTAQFEMPEDMRRLGVDSETLMLDQVELRFGISDPRGLDDNARVSVDGEVLQLQPGNGPAATGGSGFSALASWDGTAPLRVEWQYGLRGSHSLDLIPRGGETEWTVNSSWQHPSFSGFLPDTKEVGAEGFTATFEGITNLALGEALVATEDDAATVAASIGLVDPVDLYSQVDRAVKYGFLFIGFTFVTFLMFDIVGGARVAAAEYLLTGAGLILFFVMLLAFAEVIGFGLAYLVAAVAVIGLLTAYSAAVLGTWKRASFIGIMLGALYALLFVLLNMETYSLLIGSLLLFAGLAGIMYMTRQVNWSSVGRSAPEELVA